MKNIITQKVQVVKIEEQVISESRICNKCGKEYFMSMYDNDNYFYNNMHNVTIPFMYGGDIQDSLWKFDLCSECLKEFVETFMHKPEGYGVNELDAYEEYSKALKRELNKANKEEYMLTGFKNEDGSIDFEMQ
jgi:protein-arginine kinase activator protein McsA